MVFTVKFRQSVGLFAAHAPRTAPSSAQQWDALLQQLCPNPSMGWQGTEPWLPLPARRRHHAAPCLHGSWGRADGHATRAEPPDHCGCPRAGYCVRLQWEQPQRALRPPPGHVWVPPKQPPAPAQPLAGDSHQAQLRPGT